MTASALYSGEVYHRRPGPPAHAFSYRLVWLYLDLDELPEVFAASRLWSLERPNLGWFRRADYMAPTDRPLREVVLDRVEQELGRRPEGAVRLLSQVRRLGYVFNPVSFYYCFDADGELEAVAAEITNTPWRERHTYVLDARQAGDAEALEVRFPKRFHVSPFFDIDQEYLWRFGLPGERLEVHMTNLEGGQPVFHAGMRCAREALDARSLRRLLLRRPFQTLFVHAAIYWHAARLWLKRAPFFSHPAKRATEGA